jgi:hypothetical protein
MRHKPASTRNGGDLVHAQLNCELKMTGAAQQIAARLTKKGEELANLPEKRSNQMAKFGGAAFSIPFRASHIAGFRRQLPLPQRFSWHRFPRVPAWSTSAAN